jgi:Uma2 family endonuclease
MVIEMPLHATRRPFTLGEYLRLTAEGVLGPEERVELIDGEILTMTPIGPLHAGTVNALNRLLTRLLDGRAVVAVQNPVVLGEHLMPQPDLSVARLRPDAYRLAHPTAEDLLLLVEVADSSLVLDQQHKVPLYAAAGVAEVWLVDLVRRRVLAHRDPGAGGYREVIEAGPGSTVAPHAFPDAALPVDEILG